MIIENKDLWSSTISLSESLDQAISFYEETGCDLAQAEHDYNILLRQKSLTDKENGMPVTLIAQTMRGEPEVANARLQRDILQAKYMSMAEKINSLKLQLRIVNEQAKREWSDRPDYDSGAPAGIE